MNRSDSRTIRFAATNAAVEALGRRQDLRRLADGDLDPGILTLGSIEWT